MNRIGEAVDAGSDRTCRNCGTHVTEQFARVFGDERDRVYRCMSCDSKRRLHRGSAAGRVVDHPDPQNRPNRNRGARVDDSVTLEGGSQ